MTKKLNFLILLADQMQAQALEQDHPCRTPHLDRLARRGTAFQRAYTPSATCSPARASLMTGLLPHNHGVQWVTHSVEEDQGQIRKDREHWASVLKKAGYDTGYFGKWHVESTEQPQDFGWNTVFHETGPGKVRKEPHKAPDMPDTSRFKLHGLVQDPPGYPDRILYAVTESGPGKRSMGKVTNEAIRYIEQQAGNPSPWCCCVSFKEPHDPFICGLEAFEEYDPASMPLPGNEADTLLDKPNLYRRSAAIFGNLDEAGKRTCRTCYYASITEVDSMWGRILECLEASNLMENTVVVVTSDHGELLGAHGLYCKNVSAFEEVYNIPLIMAGPGVAQGERTSARVGLHDLYPTLLDLAGLKDQTPDIDGVSFNRVLQNPREAEASFCEGYAEYHGSRFLLSQRIYWKDEWKYVFNGFDYDELYNLKEDPCERVNLASDPEHHAIALRMMRGIWNRIEASRDTSLMNTSYAPLRIGLCGPRHDI